MVEWEWQENKENKNVPINFKLKRFIARRI